MKFFHFQISQETVFVFKAKISTSPETRYYIILWNLSAQSYHQTFVISPQLIFYVMFNKT